MNYANATTGCGTSYLTEDCDIDRKEVAQVKISVSITFQNKYLVGRVTGGYPVGPGGQGGREFEYSIRVEYFPRGR